MCVLPPAGFAPKTAPATEIVTDARGIGAAAEVQVQHRSTDVTRYLYAPPGRDAIAGIDDEGCI
jgi:hypothetical protein